jgi:hypothetical protein
VLEKLVASTGDAARQLAASLGFTTYSMLKRDWVFVTTNGAMVANALVGCLLFRRNRHPPTGALTPRAKSHIRRSRSPR